MPPYLADILASHRARAAADHRQLGDLVERAAATPPPRDFTGALKGEGLTCIAEIKRRSPSKGDLDPGLQPDLVAKEYVAGGAACLSVLTDEDYFGGSAGDLALARQASGLPVLRKDFTVQEADVADARLMGADAVLLIVAALDDDELKRCAARRRGARSGRAGRGARRGGARPCPGGGSTARGGQPTRPAHVQRRSRARLRTGGAHPRRGDRGRRVGHPRRRRRPPPGRRRLRRHPGRRDACPRRRTGWRSSGSWWGIPLGRDDGGPLRQDLRHHVGSRRAPRGEPRGLRGGLHLRPLPAPGLGAARRGHRKTAARARADGGRLPQRGAPARRGGGADCRARRGAAPRAGDGGGDASGCAPGSTQ